MNEDEIFVDIEGYEGLYQVSNFGRVKSLKDNHGNPREKILKFWKNRGGYLLVNLHKNRKGKTYTVHRLVANAFIENPNNLPMINHKDENPLNNCVDNLEWCDAKYNNTYGSRITKAVANTNYKTIGKKNAEKLTNRQDLSKQVYQYDLNGNLIKIWQSTHECGRNGYDRTCVSKCCIGKLKTYKNYIWSYVEIKK